MNEKSARALKRVATLSALAAIFVVVYRHYAYGPTEFDKAIWIQGDKAGFSSEAPRLRMADGLVQSGVLLGKTQGAIDAFLGPQTPTENFRPEYDYVYWLGAERSFISIDSEWLVLKFGSDGLVSEARIVRD